MKPERKLWMTLKEQTKGLPNLFLTRIETGIILPGIPDVHGIWNGVPFWLELKICSLKRNSFKCNVSPHQIGWQTQYTRQGGIVWNLIHRPSSSELILFPGERIMEAVENLPLSTAPYRETMSDVSWPTVFDTITIKREG